MRKAIAGIIMMLCFVWFPGQAMAATSDTITVTVSLAEEVAVSLDTATWAIGSITLGGSDSPATITATNDGNVAADLEIRATNGAGGWTLAGSPGADAFSVDLASPSISLSTSDQTLATNVASSGTKSIDLTYNAPTSDTVGPATNQGFSITVSATKYVP
jgi:hypothetical protein